VNLSRFFSLDPWLEPVERDEAVRRIEVGCDGVAWSFLAVGTLGLDLGEKPERGPGTVALDSCPGESRAGGASRCGGPRGGGAVLDLWCEMGWAADDGDPGRGEGVREAGESRWGMRSMPDRMSDAEAMLAYDASAAFWANVLNTPGEVTATDNGLFVPATCRSAADHSPQTFPHNRHDNSRHPEGMTWHLS
jgi:hypothetical protein